MKYKLLKELPLAYIWDEVEYFESTTEIRKKWVAIAYLHKNLISEWLEEVKEPKTIYDLKKGDKYYVLDDWNEITKYEVPSNAYFYNPYCRFSCFVTEREAKRHKLLRELDTRTDKWLPEQWDKYYSYHLDWCDSWIWQWDNTDIIKYHMWLVFRNEEEYSRWLTEDNKKLLFEI